MKSIFKAIEPYGFEQEFVDDNFTAEKPYTDIYPPEPNWKPVFDYEKNEWIETATEEERKPKPDKLPDTPSDSERLEELEKKMNDLEEKLDSKK